RRAARPRRRLPGAEPARQSLSVLELVRARAVAGDGERVCADPGHRAARAGRAGPARGARRGHRLLGGSLDGGEPRVRGPRGRRGRGRAGRRPLPMRGRRRGGHPVHAGLHGRWRCRRGRVRPGHGLARLALAGRARSGRESSQPQGAGNDVRARAGRRPGRHLHRRRRRARRLSRCARLSRAGDVAGAGDGPRVEWRRCAQHTRLAPGPLGHRAHARLPAGVPLTMPGQRRLALGVLIGAAVLAIAAFPFRATWWGGWILAVAEAGIVGGLADWFAVTAIFRRPLGLPIPHTAIIPANWELMAERVGVMVGGRVLTREYVRDEIARFDRAAVLARGAERLRPADLESAVRAVARWAVDEVSPAATSDMAGWLTRLARAHPIAPLLATAVEIARKQGWDQRLIEATAEALIDALGRPDFRAAVGDIVDDVVAGYRAQLTLYPRLLVGLASTFGLIDRERLVSALHDALKRIA